ncbi:Putative single strand-annealing protein [uncultured Mediterranean phage uvMED]|nr:Putative single strand-annealing protein [uncultured Mediterranean phage uvMED]
MIVKNIYQKLHQACLSAGGVKKGEKVKGMHFNPLLHDAVQEVATQALLDQKLYPTCSYKTDTHDNYIMVTCFMTIHDIENVNEKIEVNGCSAMGGLDKFGTGQAMSYSRKYAFLNVLNLKTGIKDDDGYEAKPFEEVKKIPSTNGKKNIKLDMELDMGLIKNDIKKIDDIYALRKWRKDNSDLFDSNNKSLREYKQITDLYETHETKLNQGVITNG